MIRMAVLTRPGQRWRSVGGSYEFEVLGRSGALGWMVRLEDGVTTVIDDLDFRHGESYELIEASGF